MTLLPAPHLAHQRQQVPPSFLTLREGAAGFGTETEVHGKRAAAGAALLDGAAGGPVGPSANLLLHLLVLPAS